jgi:hypothetical protein
MRDRLASVAQLRYERLWMLARAIPRREQRRGELDVMASRDPHPRPEQVRVQRLRRRPYPAHAGHALVRGDRSRQVRDQLRQASGRVVVTEPGQQPAAIRGRHDSYPHIQIVLHGADKPRAPPLPAAHEAAIGDGAGGSAVARGAAELDGVISGRLLGL